MARFLGGLFILLMAFGGVADAQNGIDPQCAKMRDKVGCTCALKNGGGIDAKGNWYTRNSRALNDAFVQCQLRLGKR